MFAEAVKVQVVVMVIWNLQNIFLQMALTNSEDAGVCVAALNMLRGALSLDKAQV